MQVKRRADGDLVLSLEMAAHVVVTVQRVAAAGADKGMGDQTARGEGRGDNVLRVFHSISPSECSV